GYWPLDGSVTNWTTSTFSDISGQGNDASSTVMSTSTSPVAGKIGQALKFDGSSQFLKVSNVTLGNLTSNITVSAWINANTVAPANQRIIGVDRSITTNSGISFGLQSGNLIFSANGVHDYVSAGAITA